MQKALGVAFVVVFACGFIYCVGDDPTTPTSSSSGDGGSSSGASSGNSSSGASSSGSSGDLDAGGDGDAASAPLATIPSVGVGLYFSCALRMNGHVYCWGTDTTGQLGNNVSGAGGPTVQEVSQLTDAARLAVGTSGVCVAHRDHTVSCWGDNGVGATGQPIATTQLLIPTKVSGLADVIDISGGHDHYCVRKADKSVWCWGGNESHQLGYDNSTDSSCQSSQKCNPVPQKVGTIVADGIAAGFTHTCARVGAKAVCWGMNGNAQLGHLPGQGTPADISGANPVPQEASATGVSALFAHGWSTCMLDGSGTVKCWGQGTNGQLGDKGVTTQSADPVTIAGLPSGAVSVAPGWINACAVQNGSAWCWGATGYGAEGVDAGTGSSAAPATRITAWGVKTVIDVASNHPGAHHCALMDDQAVWCWGMNNSGECGIQSSTNPAPPTQVSGLP
jgi:alpha-tubulin suppressor-like RCC1 family protein